MVQYTVVGSRFDDWVAVDPSDHTGSTSFLN